MEKYYFDCLPDEVISTHILMYLKKKDIGKILEIGYFKHREEMLKNYIQHKYPYLYHKKSWFDQTWYHYFKTLLKSKIVPLVYKGKIIDHVLVENENNAIKYLICPGKSHIGIFAYLTKSPYNGGKDILSYDISSFFQISRLYLVKDSYISSSSYSSFENIFIIVDVSYLLMTKTRMLGTDPSPTTVPTVDEYRVPYNIIWSCLFSEINEYPVYIYKRNNNLFLIRNNEKLSQSSELYYRIGIYFYRYYHKDLKNISESLDLKIDSSSCDQDQTRKLIFDKLKLLGHYYNFDT